MNEHLRHYLQMKRKHHGQDIVSFRWLGDDDPRVVTHYAECIKNKKLVISNFK